jgi:hypothetical protein
MIIKSTFIFGILSATAAVALITGTFASEQTVLGLSIGFQFTNHVQAREKIFFDGQNQADFKQVSDCSASTHEPNSPILPGSCTSNSCSSNGEMVPCSEAFPRADANITAKDGSGATSTTIHSP